jgi:hypothetical protein
MLIFSLRSSYCLRLCRRCQGRGHYATPSAVQCKSGHTLRNGMHLSRKWASQWILFWPLLFHTVTFSVIYCAKILAWFRQRIKEEVDLCLSRLHV